MTRTVRTMLFFTLAFQAGCAHNSTYIDLIYPPESEIAYDSLAGVDAQSKLNKAEYISLDVQDRRANTYTVGRLYTGMLGESYSDYLTDQNVLTWVYDAIAAEFDALGVEVLYAGDDATSGAGDQLQVSIELLQARCALDCDGEVTLGAKLTRSGSGSVVAEFPVDIESKGYTWFRVESVAEEVLARAVQMSIRQMLVEFNYVSLEREN